MSDLTTVKAVLEWKTQVDLNYRPDADDIAIAKRIAQNERFRRAYSAFRFSAVTETSEEILWRLLDEMRAVLEDTK